jgi:hypothetical protein
MDTLPAEARWLTAREKQSVLDDLEEDHHQAGPRTHNNSDHRFLVASHIKPWRLSDNSERLDGNNSLLLSPHVDTSCSSEARCKLHLDV